MKAIKVIFLDSKYNYVTSVNPQACEEGLKRYFIGSLFNIGRFPIENFQKCINIEFLN